MSEQAEVTDPFRVKLLSIITAINGINEFKNFSTFNHFKEIEARWSIERKLAASKSNPILFTSHKVRGPTQA